MAHDESVIYLNVAWVERRSTVNGPGVRAVVWVQGCTIGCPGCFNVHTHAHERRHLAAPEVLARELLREPGLDGITLTGGEPFEQAAASALLAETVQAQGGSVVVFTGYPLPYLQKAAAPAVARLLDNIDLLVAGPYLKGRALDGKRLLGSSNQRLHFLTSRYREKDLTSVTDSPVIEANFDGGMLRWTGFPAEDDLTLLKEGMGIPV